MNSALVYRALLTLLNAVLAAGGLLAVIYLVKQAPSVENQALLALVSMVVGAFVREYGSSNQWWFGSSKGSSDKTEMLGK